MHARNAQRQFGRRIKLLRKQRGLSQEALAEAIDKTVATISNIERGAVPPKFATLCDLATALGTDLAGLFELVRDKPPDDAERQRNEALSGLVGQLREESAETIAAVGEIVRLIQARGRPVAVARKRKPRR